MNVAPGSAYTSRLALGVAQTGLVGTVRYRLLDNDTTVDDPVYGPSTSGIIEDPTGTGSYLFHGTAPSVAGDYSPAWDMGVGTDLVYDEDLVVTYSPIPGATGSLYITRNEMRAALSYSPGATYADDDIDRACNAVSRAIDEACRGIGSHFFQATETRYYTPDEFNCTYASGYYGPEHRLEIEDLVSASSVTVDPAGAGTYTTAWTEGTDFFLDPANAATDGKPFEELLLRSRGGRYFPRVQRGVKIVGTFGWPSVPPQVSQYALFFASQTVLRTRQAPFGILMQGMEVGATARLMRVDPDYERFLGSLTRTKLFI